MQKPFLTLIFLLTFFQVSGQDIRLGLRFSPQFAFFKPDQPGVENDGLKAGMSYALMMEFLFSERYALSTGLGLNHTGGKYSFNDTGNILSFQYIEVPLTLKMRTNEIGYITYFGKFGGNFGFNTKARLTNPSLNISDADVKSDIIPIKAELIIGAGAEYSLGGNTALLGGISFHNGFSRIYKQKAHNHVTLRPASISIDLGILF